MQAAGHDWHSIHPLGLGQGPLETAWQTFEVLRLAVNALDPRFPDRAREFSGAEAVLAVSAAEQQQGDREERNKALGRISELVHVRRPHLLLVDRRLDDRWDNPAALKLAASIEADPLNDALAAAGLVQEPTDLRIALLAVSKAAGRVADDLAWVGVPAHQAVFIQDEVWLDNHVRQNRA